MKKVFLYVHSHWDREWYREFEEFRLRLIEVVDDVLEKLQNGDLPSFYFDGQTAAIEDYLAIHPEKENIVRKLIKSKKLFIGPFYCSADSFLSSAEFLIRNLCIGTEYSKRFGCNDFIGYLSDTFGHSAGMPDILKCCGIDKVMLWRGLGNLPSEFTWKNIAATYLIQGYFQDILSLNADFDKKAELLEKFIDKIAERSSKQILLPCGADHLKVADDLKTQIAEINVRLKNYELKIASPFEYLKKVEKLKRPKVEGEFLDAGKNFLLKGVYSSRIYQKRQNADVQWKLSRVCEPAATICNILNFSKNWQNEIDYAYKNTIKNHAHDSIYGCSTDKVHEDVAHRFTHTLQVVDGINKRLVRDLSDDGDELSFFNLSNFKYSGVVEVETDRKLSAKYRPQLVSSRRGFTDKKLFNPSEIPVTEDYTTIKKYLVEVRDLAPFSITNGKINTRKSHNITESSIENSYLSLKVIQNAIEVTDKLSGKVYENFIQIVDRADVGDSYNFGAMKGDKPIIANIISSEVLVKGHLKSTLRVVFEIHIPYSSHISNEARGISKSKHHIAVDVSLTNSSKYFEFKIDWDNKSLNHLLQVRFNFEKPVNTTFSEDLTGITKRDFDTDYNIYQHLPAKRGVELKTNTAPMQRFVWAQGVGILTKGLNEYEIFKNTLGITILRSTGLISQPLNPTRGTPAGPPIPCPDLQCLGKNSVEFALTFTDNPDKLYSVAESFYGAVIPVFTGKLLESFFKVNNKKILLQALKLGAEQTLIFRFVNTSDKKEKFRFSPPEGVSEVLLTDSLERVKSVVDGDISVLANEVITLKCKK